MSTERPWPALVLTPRLLSGLPLIHSGEARPAVPPEAELEALLYLLRELPQDCPEYSRTEARVA